MRSRLVAPCLAAVLSVALTGCGGAEEPAAKSAPRTSSTPTASSSPTASPDPDAPPGLDETGPTRPTAQAETSGSALEFGRYFALLVQYAIETRNGRVIRDEARTLSGCTNCVSVIALISDLRRTGYWQRSEPPQLGPFRAVAMVGGYRVKGSFVYPEVDDVRVSGKVVQTVPATPYRYWVDLAWDERNQTWQVLDFIYGKKKG